jgi:ketosteroid isomerase-like protein
MADRDYARFGTFVSEEAIFFSGPTPIRGRSQVMMAWKRFYDSAEAPFSWEPETVQVLESGTLALSTGPVRDARGKLLATFTSIWRLEGPGVWRVIFDRGSDVCECAGK